MHTALWNTNLIAAPAHTLIEKLKTYAGREYQSATEKLEGASGAARQQILEEIYSAPNDSGGSFSYQVLTKLGGQEAILVASDFDWKDIGTWQEYVKLVPADNRGNYAVGNNVSLDEGSSGNYVANFTGKKVVIEGAEGLLIIHTDNATLIAPKDLSGEKTKELRDTLLTDSRFNSYFREIIPEKGDAYVINSEAEDFSSKEGLLIAVDIKDVRGKRQEDGIYIYGSTAKQAQQGKQEALRQLAQDPRLEQVNQSLDEVVSGARLAIFDLDETIQLTNRQGLGQARLQALEETITSIAKEKMGRELKLEEITRHLPDQTEFMSQKGQAIIQQVTEALGLRLTDREITQYYQQYAKRRLELSKGLPPPVLVDGLKEFATGLRKRGVKISVVTGSGQGGFDLQRAEGYDLVDRIDENV